MKRPRSCLVPVRGAATVEQNLMFRLLTQKGTFRSRRHFLRMTSALAMGTIYAPILKARARATDSRVGEIEAKSGSIMQIGILLGTFPEPTYEAKLDAVKSCGLACIQLSLDCAGVEAMPDQISSELAERIRREATARKITIASVQGTFNMSHPDSQHRQKGLRRLRVLAEASSQIGTSKIHLCTGTRDPENMWRRHPANDSPEAWKDMVTCVRSAVDIAKQTGVVLGFEPEVILKEPTPRYGGLRHAEHDTRPPYKGEGFAPRASSR